MAPVPKLVLAYSGGLDTTVAIPWLSENMSCEVIAYLADLGQQEDLAAAKDKALASGATHAFVDDLRERFVSEYVYPAFRAGALFEGKYLLGTALARPCIGEGMMKLVQEQGAQFIAHGATGKGNDQVRFEFAAYHFVPDIKIVAPWRQWEFQGRRELIAYAQERGLDIEASVDKPYSIDRNLLHTSYEGGILEDPWASPPEDMYQRTASVSDAPDAPVELVLRFEMGIPVSIDGKTLDPVAMLESLNTLAGTHGIGRVDIVENRYVGMKSRGVYETPGGAVLWSALRALESLTLDRELSDLKAELLPKYSRLLYEGKWFSPEREALQQMFDGIAESVSGDVRLRLNKAQVTVLGRRSPNSLYSEQLASFEDSQARGVDAYDQRDAQGFIRLNALRMRIRSNLAKKQN